MLRRRLVLSVPAVAVLFAAACSDSVAPPARTLNREQHALANNSEGRGVFQRYAAIGIGRTDVKPAFSVLGLMTTAQPYGPYYSLDGVHPSGLGSGVLADAAAQAINERYGLGIPLILDN